MSDTQASEAETILGAVLIKPAIGAFSGAALLTAYGQQGLSYRLPINLGTREYYVPVWALGAALGALDSYLGDLVHEMIVGISSDEKLQSLSSFIATLAIGAASWSLAFYVLNMKAASGDYAKMGTIGAVNAFVTQAIFEMFVADQNRTPTLF